MYLLRSRFFISSTSVAFRSFFDAWNHVGRVPIDIFLFIKTYAVLASSVSYQSLQDFFSVDGFRVESDMAYVASVKKVLFCGRFFLLTPFMRMVTKNLLST